MQISDETHSNSSKQRQNFLLICRFVSPSCRLLSTFLVIYARSTFFHSRLSSALCVPRWFSSRPEKGTEQREIWKLFEKFSSIRQRKKFMLLFLGSVVCFYFIFRFYKFSLTCNRVQKKQQQQSAIRREWKRMMRRKATKKTKHNSEKKRIYDETATAARKGRNKGDNDAIRRHRWCDIKA